MEGNKTIKTQFGETIITDNNVTMEELAKSRVCGVVEQDGKYYLMELCDSYFSIELDKGKCLNIAQFLKDLSEKC